MGLTKRGGEEKKKKKKRRYAWCALVAELILISCYCYKVNGDAFYVKGASPVACRNQ